MAGETISLDVQGDHLDCTYYAPPKPRRARGGVVWVHGFNSCKREFGDAPAAMAAAGLHVMTVDLRGHGESGGERGLTSLDRAIVDLSEAGAALTKRIGHAANLGLLGHSLGGAYAIGFLAQRAEYSCAAVLHPVDCLLDELGPLERFGYHIIGRINRRRAANGKDNGSIPYKLKTADLFVSSEAAQAAEQQNFLLPTVNLGSYGPAAAMRASDWAKSVQQPVLGIWSRHDKAVAPRRSHRVFNALSGPLEMMEHQGGHSAFLDSDGDAITQRTTQWFLSHLGG